MRIHIFFIGIALAAIPANSFYVENYLSSQRNCYTILDAPLNANAAVLFEAFKKRSAILDPNNGGNAALFKEMNWCYTVCLKNNRVAYHNKLIESLKKVAAPKSTSPFNVLNYLTPQKNCYTILNVAQTATDSEIQKAYKTKLLKVHPDKGGDANLFNELQWCYTEWLKENRKAYDTKLAANAFNESDYLSSRKNCYMVFGVPYSATVDELSEAYNKKIIIYHNGKKKALLRELNWCVTVFWGNNRKAYNENLAANLKKESATRPKPAFHVSNYLSSETNCYKVLDISQKATAAEITRAYSDKLNKVHPDKGGDTALFQELQWCYNVCLTSQKVAYDNYLLQSTAKAKTNPDSQAQVDLTKVKHPSNIPVDKDKVTKQNKDIQKDELRNESRNEERKHKDKSENASNINQEEKISCNGGAVDSSVSLEKEDYNGKGCQEPTKTEETEEGLTQEEESIKRNREGMEKKDEENKQSEELREKQKAKISDSDESSEFSDSASESSEESIFGDDPFVLKLRRMMRQARVAEKMMRKQNLEKENSKKAGEKIQEMSGFDDSKETQDDSSLDKSCDNVSTDISADESMKSSASSTNVSLDKGTAGKSSTSDIEDITSSDGENEKSSESDSQDITSTDSDNAKSPGSEAANSTSTDGENAKSSGSEGEASTFTDNEGITSTDTEPSKLFGSHRTSADIDASESSGNGDEDITSNYSKEQSDVSDDSSAENGLKDKKSEDDGLRKDDIQQPDISKRASFPTLGAKKPLPKPKQNENQAKEKVNETNSKSSEPDAAISVTISASVVIFSLSIAFIF